MSRHTSFASINFVFCVGGARTFFIKASATWRIGVIIIDRNGPLPDGLAQFLCFFLKKGKRNSKINLIRRTKVTDVLLARGNRVDAHTLQRFYDIFVHLILALHCHFLPAERVEEGVTSLLVDDRQEPFLRLCCDYSRSEWHSVLTK